MDNSIDIDIWKISRRFLINYYPAWFFYCMLFSMLYITAVGIKIVLLFAFLMILTLAIYLFIIMPIIIFRPKKSFNRRMVMFISSTIFTALSTIAYKYFTPYSFLNPALAFQEMIAVGFTIFSIGGLICLLFNEEVKQYAAETRIISERKKRINNEKRVTETHLKLLQAQIEPHFLFNTLSSILGLIDRNPQKAKIMHNNFIQYLKTTLGNTRSSVTTVGQDIELIKAYLDIFKVRMGKRLHYSIETDSEVSVLPFPSMLIQPIVENAVKHGIEPKIEGGKIRIKVTKKEKKRLCWEIEDTGLGMSDTSHLGTGISNVMERVEALYGKEGSLKIEENHPSGVKAILEMPYV